MSKIVDKNTFWSLKKNPLSDEGVYMYSGKMVGDPNLDPDELVPVYRPASELEKAVETFEAIPFIEDHEMIGGNATDYDKRPAGGVVTNPVVENGRMFGDLKIFSEKLKSAIEKGKKELSLGYRCIYEKCSGVFNGKAYKYVQRNLVGNHLALVSEGRMGSEVRVYDSCTVDSLEIDTTKNITKEIIMSKGKDAKTCDEFVSVETLYKKFPNEKDWIDSVKYKRNEDKAEESKTEEEPKEEPKKDESKANEETKDENVDKRKLIDEIGGILKDKVSEEDWRTIIGKIEKASYNKSESGKADDEDEDKKKEEPKKEEPKKEEPKGEEEGKDEESEKDKEISAMDEAEKSLKARFRLGEEFAKIISEDVGTFDHSEMTLREIADYGCEKLGLDSIEGDNITKMSVYSKTRKAAQERYGLDSSHTQKVKSSGINKGISEYINNK